VDPYFKQLLTQVAGDEELEEVEISPDGKWKKKFQEELLDQSPAIKKKRLSSNNTKEKDSGIKSDPTSSSLSIGNTASMPVAIDLSLTSDDDEEEEEEDQPLIPSRTKSKQKNTSTNTGSGTSESTNSNAIALDGILTVNSDAWSGTNGTSTGASGDTNVFDLLDGALLSAAANGPPSGISSVNIQPPNNNALSTAGLDAMVNRWSQMYDLPPQISTTNTVFPVPNGISSNGPVIAPRPPSSMVQLPPPAQIFHGSTFIPLNTSNTSKRLPPVLANTSIDSRTFLDPALEPLAASDLVDSICNENINSPKPSSINSNSTNSTSSSSSSSISSSSSSSSINRTVPRPSPSPAAAVNVICLLDSDSE
jgi:hypothetical protein